MSFPRFQVVSDPNAFDDAITVETIALNPAWIVLVEADKKNAERTVIQTTNGLANRWLTVQMPFDQVVNNLNHAQRSIVEVCQ